MLYTRSQVMEASVEFHLSVKYFVEQLEREWGRDLCISPNHFKLFITNMKESLKSHFLDMEARKKRQAALNMREKFAHAILGIPLD